MKKPRKLVTAFCAIIFALQSGCATTPSSSQPTEQVDISKLGTVALAAVQFAPETYHTESSSTQVEPAFNLGGSKPDCHCGAGLGQYSRELGKHPEACLKFWDRFLDGVQDSGSLVVGLGIMFYCPAFAGVGAAMNAIDKRKDRKDVPMITRPELSGMAPQKTLREYVTQYAAERALPPIAVLEGQGPSKPAELPAYYSPPDQSINTVLEVGITELFAVKSQGSDFIYFGLTGRGRLIRIRESTEQVRDNMVLDGFTDMFYTNSYTLDEWLADDGKLLSSELAHGYRNLAEAFVNKWLIQHQEEIARRQENVAL